MAQDFATMLIESIIAHMTNPPLTDQQAKDVTRVMVDKVRALLASGSTLPAVPELQRLLAETLSDLGIAR